MSYETYKAAPEQSKKALKLSYEKLWQVKSDTIFDIGKYAGNCKTCYDLR